MIQPAINIFFSSSLSRAFCALAWVNLFCLFTLTAQTKFSEKAASFGLDLDGAKDGGFTFADFNNDGVLDLLLNTEVNSATHRSRIYFNSAGTGGTGYGYGGFNDVTNTKAKGLIATGLAGGSVLERTAIAGDINNDGNIDILRNSSTRIELFLNNGVLSGYTFGQGPDQEPNFFLYTNGSGDANPPNGIPNGMNAEGMGLLDYDNDGDLDLMIENHNWGIEIYENNLIPSGTFSLTHATPGTGSPLGLDQSAVDGDYASVTDFDDDGYIDIVARKQNMQDFWRNNGDGTFSAVNWVDQNADNNDKGAVSLYDFDNDGDYDLVWTNSGVNQIWQQTGIGSGTFIATNEPETSSGVTLPLSGVDGLACGDVDNDGDIDLFLGNDNGPSFLFINKTPAGSSSLVFEQDNDKIDVDGDAEGAVFVDIDTDGDLDLYINVNNGPNQLWINKLKKSDQKNHLYVRVFENLNNTIHPRDAIGANIILKDCAGNIISGIREVNGGNGHGTQDPAFVHFGLPNGEDETYIVEVHYPYLNGTRRIAQHRVVPEDLGEYHLLEITPQTALSTPTAVDDNGGDMLLGATSVYDVLANDSDPAGESFYITNITGAPAAGTATIINSGQEIQYTNSTAFGTFTINYQICKTVCGGLCDEATLTVSVIPEADYGDAPSSYGEICYTINPVGHSINPAGIPFAPTRFGNLVDGEMGNPASLDATGDDANGVDDDDGIVFVGGTSLMKNTNESVSFTWSTNDGDGHIYGWIDFDRNGVFDDPGERIITNYQVGNGTPNGSAGSATISYRVPTTADCGETYARFTIQSEAALFGPTGDFCSTNDPSRDGEVEDYVVYILGCVEDCNNGVDDDGDGLIDCDDPDCYNNLLLAVTHDETICEGESTTMVANASGGNGSYTYTWDNGLGIGNSHTVSPIVTTTYQVTVSDVNGCTATNQITITVVSNYTTGGSIGSNEQVCGNFDPANIFNLSLPSGGSGGANEYRWQSRSYNCVTNSYSAWTTIAGATNASYDPTVITITTEYRRQARNLPCATWQNSNVVRKEVVNSFTAAGSIAGAEASCTAFDPNLITNTGNPSGACSATIQYRWQRRTGDHCTNTWSRWITIPSTNSPNYNPPAISNTTQYRRQVRNFPCTTWQSTGTVTKEIDTTEPVISCTPNDLTVECAGSVTNQTAATDWNAANILALQNCSTDACSNVTVSSDFDFNNFIFDCALSGEIQVTYLVSDDCNNESSFQANFYIVDTTAPTVSPISDLVVACDNIPVAGIPLVVDDCDNNPDVSFQEAVIYHPTSVWKASTSCTLLYEVSSATHDDGGSPSNPGDDEMSFTITIIGKEIGSGWTANINGTIISGSYYQTYSLGPFSSNGSVLNFTLVDNVNASCNRPVTIDIANF